MFAVQHLAAAVMLFWNCGKSKNELALWNVELKCVTPTCSRIDLELTQTLVWVAQHWFWHLHSKSETSALRMGAEDKLLLVLCCLYFSLLAHMQTFWKSQVYWSVWKTWIIWDFSANFYTSLCLFGYLMHTVEVSTNSKKCQNNSWM